MTNYLKQYARKNIFNIQNKGSYRGIKKKKDLKNKFQSGMHKSYLISNYIKCKWIKYYNQQARLGRMVKTTKTVIYPCAV